MGWKLVPVGKSAKVKAKVTEGNVKDQDIKFINGAGTEYTTVKKEQGYYHVTVAGSAHGDGQRLYAMVKQDSVWVAAGQVNIASYKMKQLNLMLVPMYGAEVERDQYAEMLSKV